jgi:hypothetical protein
MIKAFKYKLYNSKRNSTLLGKLNWHQIYIIIVLHYIKDIIDYSKSL